MQIDQPDATFPIIEVNAHEDAVSPELPPTTPATHKTLIISLLLFIAAVGIGSALYFKYVYQQAPFSTDSTGSTQLAAENSSSVDSATTPPPAETESQLLTYTNKLAGYTFTYPIRDFTITPGGDITDPTEADMIYIFPNPRNDSVKEMTIRIGHSQFGINYKSEEGLVKDGILGYFASSNSMYPDAQNNKVSQVKTTDNSYMFEIAWAENAPNEERHGIDVWVFYPLTKVAYPLTDDQRDDAKFLWVSYPKDEPVYTPILNSLKRQPIQ
jgi:hypothetical protein